MNNISTFKEKKQTLSIINEWFDLIEKLELGDLSAEEIHRHVGTSILRRITIDLEKIPTNL